MNSLEVIKDFDYSLVDFETQEFLQERSNIIYGIQSKSTYEIGILRTISTIFQNGDDEASQLKNEINSSISDLLLDRYENGLRKLTAIMTHVTSVQLNKPAVASIPNFIGISEKKGICHTLVNDGMFTWVDYE